MNWMCAYGDGGGCVKFESWTRTRWNSSNWEAHGMGLGCLLNVFTADTSVDACCRCANYRLLLAHLLTFAPLRSVADALFYSGPKNGMVAFGFEFIRSIRCSAATTFSSDLNANVCSLFLFRICLFKIHRTKSHSVLVMFKHFSSPFRWCAHCWMWNVQSVCSTPFSSQFVYKWIGRSADVDREQLPHGDNETRRSSYGASWLTQIKDSFACIQINIISMPICFLLIRLVRKMANEYIWSIDWWRKRTREQTDTS